MSVAMAQEHNDPIDSHRVGSRRACGSLACTTEGTISRHGCHIRPVSPCAALSDIGDAGVPPLGTFRHSFPPGHDIVEAGDAGHFFSARAQRIDIEAACSLAVLRDLTRVDGEWRCSQRGMT